MDGGLFDHDSVRLAIATESTVETGKLQPTVEGRYGLVLINALAYLIPHIVFGIESSESIITIMTIIFSSLAVLMFYLFVKELLNSSFIAFTSSLLLAFHPLFFSVSTYATNHAFSMFFIVLSGYFLLKALKTDLARYKVLFGLSAGFILYVRFSDIITLFPLILIYIFSEKILVKGQIKLKKKFSLKNLLLIYGPLIIMFVVHILFQPSFIVQRLVANEFLQTQEIMLTFTILLIKSTTILGSFLVLYGLANSMKNKKYLVLILFIWLILVFIFYSSFLTSTIRFLVPALIPLTIFMGISLDTIKEWYSILSIIILLLVLSSMFLFIYPIVQFRHNYSSGKEYVGYVDKLAENKSLIIDWGDYMVFYDYYTSREGDVIGCPLTDDLNEFNEKMRAINEAIRNDIPVYISQFCSVIGTQEQRERLFNALNDNYALRIIGKVIVDDYHHNSINLLKQSVKIYKIEPREK